MITYKAMYRQSDGWVLGRVVDFPGVLTQGYDLEDARDMLADALTLMAETTLMAGEPLPKPDPQKTDNDFEIVEPIYLYLNASSTMPDESMTEMIDEES